VTPTSLLLTPLLGSSISLTASGGPVTWSITESSSLLGHLTVSPASGRLAAGQTATVSVTAGSVVSLLGQLTLNPGGTTVTVTIGVNLAG
jgi:Viral BACON domain